MTDLQPATSLESLLVIDAPHFYCGVVLRDEQVIRAAPIVCYLTGWNLDRVQRYAQRRGWQVETIPRNGGGYEPTT